MTLPPTPPPTLHPIAPWTEIGDLVDKKLCYAIVNLNPTFGDVDKKHDVKLH